MMPLNINLYTFFFFYKQYLSFELYNNKQDIYTHNLKKSHYTFLKGYKLSKLLYEWLCRHLSLRRTNHYYMTTLVTIIDLKSKQKTISHPPFPYFSIIYVNVNVYCMLRRDLGWFGDVGSTTYLSTLHIYLCIVYTIYINVPIRMHVPTLRDIRYIHLFI